MNFKRNRFPNNLEQVLFPNGKTFGEAPDENLCSRSSIESILFLKGQHSENYKGRTLRKNPFILSPLKHEKPEQLKDFDGCRETTEYLFWVGYGTMAGTLSDGSKNAKA